MFVVLLLSGCGISVFTHNEYVTFSDVNDTEAQERETFQSNRFCYRKVYSNQDREFTTECKEFEKNHLRISFAENSGGLVGFSPFVPIPPYIPVFLSDTNPICLVKTDLRMGIRYVADKIEDDLEIRERLNFPDISKIYLIKEDGGVIFPRNVWDSGYSYQVCFPVKPEEANNALLFVEGLSDKRGKQQSIKPQRLRYYNDSIWVIGGLVSCLSDAPTTNPESQQGF